MGRNIPTFSATRAFEATARHGNLQGASNELSISPSAVSHQIKALEMYLGIKLLIRGSSGLELTEAGKTYADDLSHVLNHLETVTLKVLNKSQSSQLTINMYQSVADLWLVSQLAGFSEIHPEIKIKIITQPEEIDLSGTDVDIAIRYQQGCNTSPQSIFLFAEYLKPVCSPEFFEKHGPFTNADQLLDQPLIVYSDTSGEWLDYFKNVGMDDVSEVSIKRELEVDSRAAALRAACEGLGFAMGRPPYTTRLIAVGKLIAPFQQEIATGNSYYLLVPDRTLLNPMAQKFRKWLVSVCGKMEM